MDTRTSERLRGPAGVQPHRLDFERVAGARMGGRADRDQIFEGAGRRGGEHKPVAPVQPQTAGADRSLAVVDEDLPEVPRAEGVPLAEDRGDLEPERLVV